MKIKGFGVIHKVWKYISNLGTGKGNFRLNSRTIMLSNQLNFLLFIATFFLLLFTIITQISIKDQMSVGTLRVLMTVLLSIINLLLAWLGFTRSSLISLIFLPSVIFLLIPTLLGYVEEEGFTYYPYVVVAISVIPQILLNPKKEKLLFWFALSYFFILVLVLDNLMVLFSPIAYPIIERINTFYPYYKIAPIGLFLFLNANIYYMRTLNFMFETQLEVKNSELNKHNIELKSQKDEIERQKDELVKKEISTWQKLVNIISHEIVNSAIPITNLAGMTGQMLEDESGSVLKPGFLQEEILEDIHHSLKVIESRTQSLINFVGATKNLTRIPKPNFRDFKIAELFERIKILYQGRFKERNIKFSFSVNQPGLKIKADMELIEQVIINLIQNSIDAMLEIPNPELMLSAYINDSGHIQIDVSDNGPGIKEDEIGKIFLPFYSSKPNNSGIGLSLSQQIMGLHHGRLDLVEGQKSGAKFVLIF
jgi:signal transduction histidine kinase